ncbi:MAG: GH3 auxin-responsive promoter family protein [Iphinoe sp. HA4291-MV1]|jgi:hypothetical protein|nr:GH3 auxin-responsive promoter family protein [Iphinoe sp. HA4291-MV1]
MMLIFQKISKKVDQLGDSLFLFLLEKSAQRSLKSLETDTAKAAQLQQKVLLEILQLQKNTEYGRKYNFAVMRSVVDFQKAHPLSTYDNYQAIIDNISNNGKFTQLVAEPIILFQETSGTTGKTKLIPRTKRLFTTVQKAFQAVQAIIQSHYLNQKIYSKNYRGLGLGNAQPLSLTPSGIPRGGATSGGIRQSKLLKKIFRLSYTSPASVFLIEDYRSAYYCHLLFALLDPDLAYISSNYASNVLEGIQILETQWRRLVNDIQSGSIDESIQLDAATREELQNLLQPNPARAEVLRTEFEQGMQGILPRIWSRLSYIQCITTGSMGLYKEKLQFYAVQVPIYSAGFGASESWLGVNLQPERNPPAYVITPHAAFFEFIPFSEIDAQQPTTVDLTSLDVGESYEIVVTTVAGLYRYRMGDIVKCVGYYHQSPMVEYQYRQGSLLNITGEKVSEQTVFTAITEAIKLLESDCELVDYTTRIEFISGSGRYVVYVEVSQTFSSLPDLNECREKIEAVIASLNTAYKQCRAENRIDQLELKLVQKDTFKLLQQMLLSTGTSNSQFKMPRLLKNPQQVELMESMAFGIG